MSLTHADGDGYPKMVDVSQKPATRRRAAAAGYMELCQECSDALANGHAQKGDPWSMARVAAISGAKLTAQVLPLAHPLTLDTIDVEHYWDSERNCAWMLVEVSCESRTGVEMEAIIGVASGLAGLYDALKSIGHRMSIGPIRLLKKEGGRRGTITAPWAECPWQPPEKQ